MLTACLTATLCVRVGGTVPHLIGYQGRLTDSGGQAVTNGSYFMSFRLFDSPAGGTEVWSESDSISTESGLFSHNLGSVQPLTEGLFTGPDTLFLELATSDGPLVPRILLVSVPYSLLAANLRSVDNSGTVSILTDGDGHTLTMYDLNGNQRLQLDGSVFGAMRIFDTSGTRALVEISATADSGGTVILSGPFADSTIQLRGGGNGDDAVVLPDSAINANEILDEPGIVVSQNLGLITLPTDAMIDLVTTEIAIPTDGYIVLEGKGYLILSGTTGPNNAVVQIDETAGGASLFPYYTQAGLSGYVNTGDSYFPYYVTRTYFKNSGTYTFRMEGRASVASPAIARSWDHILTAVFYATDYYPGSKKGIITRQSTETGLRSVKMDSTEKSDDGEVY